MWPEKSDNLNVKSVEDDHPGRAPPSYFEAISTGSWSDPKSSKNIEDLLSRMTLEQEVRNLYIHLGRARRDHVTYQEDVASIITKHLLVYLKIFLQNRSASVLVDPWNRGRSSAELILVPAHSAPATQGWVLSDLDQRRESAAYVQVIEVDPQRKEKVPGSPGHNQLDIPFGLLGEDATDLLWSRNEDLAVRVASSVRKYLVGMLGLREEKKPVSIGHNAEPGAQSRSSIRNGGGDDDERPEDMTVQVEEVTFRRENDMGLWEITSEWAIVLVLAVKT